MPTAEITRRQVSWPVAQHPSSPGLIPFTASKPVGRASSSQPHGFELYEWVTPLM